MKQTECIVGRAVVADKGRLIALACFVGLGLAGCGQKGPLYLPTPTTQPATTPQPPSPTAPAAPQATAEPEETTAPTR